MRYTYKICIHTYFTWLWLYKENEINSKFIYRIALIGINNDINVVGKVNALFNILYGGCNTSNTNKKARIQRECTYVYMHYKTVEN